MKDKHHGQSTRETRQQEQGIPASKRTGGQQQGGFPHEDGGWGEARQQEQAGGQGSQKGSQRGGFDEQQNQRTEDPVRRRHFSEQDVEDTDPGKGK